MPALQRTVMQQLYQRDVWYDFVPTGKNDDVQGWNGVHPSLEKLASLNGGIVVDVGVWKGQSTITLARAMKDNGIDGCVIAVDTFLGSPEHWWSEGPLFSRKNGLPDLYETFMANVYYAGVADYVVPLPQTSVTAANILGKIGIRPSVIHIDAAHEYAEVLRDINEYWTILLPGGYIIGDDYHESWPGVIRAAGEFSASIICPLVIEFPKWLMQKPQ